MTPTRTYRAMAARIQNVVNPRSPTRTMITPVRGRMPYAGFARRESSALIVCSANDCSDWDRSFMTASHTK
jgi:hypothetical protein